MLYEVITEGVSHARERHEGAARVLGQGACGSHEGSVLQEGRRQPEIVMPPVASVIPKPLINSIP